MGDGDRMAGSAEGRWLVGNRRVLDRGEADELVRLVAFDREQLWALDGFFNCVSWMVWFLGVARSTAFEKLRIGYELERRPAIAEAFGAGRITYSMVRVLTRAQSPSPEVDEALVDLATAEGTTIVDLEQAVRAYRLYADQDRPPIDDRPPVRDVFYRKAGEEMTTVCITLSDAEVDEFKVGLRYFTDQRWRAARGPVDESPGGDCIDGEGSGSTPDPDNPGGDVDESPVGDRSGTCGLDGVSRSTVRADAFLDLVAVARAHAGDGHAAGDDRYMVHVVTTDSGRSHQRLDGSPVHPVDASRIRCDSSTVLHAVGEDGGLLHLGRRSRRWNTDQRRGVAVRDGGYCRFPGCTNTLYDIHHIIWWELGGPTDIDNAVSACRGHHRLLHSGYRVEGTPGGELRFYRPDGSYLGSTWPVRTRTPQLVLTTT